MGYTARSIARCVPSAGSFGGQEHRRLPAKLEHTSPPATAKSKKADSSRLRRAPSVQWVPPAGESAASFPRRPRQTRKCRSQSPPTHEPAAHHDQVGKIDSHRSQHIILFFSRSRPSPRVNPSGPRRVVPVPGAVGNFPAAKSNENQLSPEKSTAHLMVSAHSQLGKSIPIAPIIPGASSHLSSFALPRPGREIINRARNRSRRRPSRGRGKKRPISVAPAT